MKFSSMFLSLSLTISVATGAPVDTQRRAFFDWDQTNFVLAFGDSWTYVQGEFGAQNFSFIGDRFHTNYSSTELYFDKIRKNETSAGGPNWVEYLTQCYEGLPLLCEKQMWNFAFAGSDMSLKYAPLHHNFSLQFDEQIELWSNHTSKFVPMDKNRALVATFIGINDIQDTSKYLLNETGPGFSRLYNKLIQTQYERLETLYKSGFKNFLVLGLPILDKTPPNLKTDHPSPNSTMIHTWNSIVKKHADLFEKRNSDSNVFYFDLYDYLDGIYRNASSYGFKNTTDICPAYDQADIGWNHEKYGCQPIEEYFWFNTGHVTYPVHKLLGQRLTSYLKEKSNFR